MLEDLNIPSQFFGRVYHYRENVTPRMVFTHRHRELEANVVVRGTASYRLFDRRVDIRRNSLLWLFPKQEHILLNTSPDFEMWVWVIKPGVLHRNCSPALCEILCQDNPPEVYCRPIPSASATELIRLVQMAKGAMSNDVDVCNSSLLHATTRALTVYQDAEKNRPMGTTAALHPAVEDAARMLAESEKSLEEIAHEIGQHPSYLSRLFHEQMGVKLVDFRNRMRIRRFLGEFGDGDEQTMVSAAFAAGFGSYPQFNRIFKQVMGVSPSRFRSELRGEARDAK